VFANFLSQKYYNPLSPPVLSKFISVRLFSSPRVANEVKELHGADVAAIQEAETDELKKVQKEEFSAAFQKMCDGEKARMYANRACFEEKRLCVFLMSLRFLKKSVSKIWTALCIT
jgi:hypothetical protein